MAANEEEIRDKANELARNIEEKIKEAEIRENLCKLAAFARRRPMTNRERNVSAIVFFVAMLGILWAISAMVSNRQPPTFLKGKEAKPMQLYLLRQKGTTLYCNGIRLSNIPTVFSLEEARSVVERLKRKRLAHGEREKIVLHAANLEIIKVDLIEKGVLRESKQKRAHAVH